MTGGIEGLSYCRPALPAWGACVLAILLGFMLPGTPAGAAQKVYKKPSDFIRGAFPRGVPGAQTISLSGDTGAGVRAILGHSYRYGSRVSFWESGSRTAWILEEIGKVEPITTGIIVDKGAISSVQILVYRESHGYEVERPFFTKQFRGARLQGGSGLSRRIDGISGATLSVRSVTRLSAMALFLHGKVAG